MGINTSPYRNGDPRIGLGIIQSLTRIGLGFVPIWDFRVSSPNWNSIQNRDPILERGSPYRNGDSLNWFPNRGVPESVWGSFQFGDQHLHWGVTYQSDGKDLVDGVEYLYWGAKLVS